MEYICLPDAPMWSDTLMSKTICDISSYIPLGRTGWEADEDDAFGDFLSPPRVAYTVVANTPRSSIPLCGVLSLRMQRKKYSDIQLQCGLVQPAMVHPERLEIVQFKFVQFLHAL